VSSNSAVRSGVIIGVDPHKLSVTIEVVDDRQVVLGVGRYRTDKAGYAALRRYVSRFGADRVWAVEGANGAGRSLAQRLLVDGERVVDVPAKLSARARLLNTGHNRKTDAVDAHSIATVAVTTEGLRELVVDGELEAIRMLADRYTELSRRRIQTVNRLHRLIAELVPGTKKKDLSAQQGKAILATVRPRDVAGRTRRRMAVEEVADLVRVDAQIRAIKAELQTAVTERGSSLMELTGVGPVGAARILADVGDVARFADRNRFASWTGTAPLDASSGEQIRHRLSRAGNRRMNHVLHVAAVVQLRHDTPGRDYYRRKLAAGKTPLEAIRCLKRRLSDAVYRRLLIDAGLSPTQHPRHLPSGAHGADPGGQRGATLQSSAADLIPPVDTSDQPLPGPADPTLQPRIATRKSPAAAPLPVAP
jgi:transposase